MYLPRLFAPAAVSPGSVSTNFRRPPVTVPKEETNAVAPPAFPLSVIVTMGLLYPVPPAVTVIEVMTPVSRVAAAAAPVPVGSVIVMTGCL